MQVEKHTYVVNNYTIVHRNVDDQTTPVIINGKFSTHTVAVNVSITEY